MAKRDESLRSGDRVVIVAGLAIIAVLLASWWSSTRVPAPSVLATGTPAETATATATATETATATRVPTRTPTVTSTPDIPTIFDREVVSYLQYLDQSHVNFGIIPLTAFRILGEEISGPRRIRLEHARKEFDVELGDVQLGEVVLPTLESDRTIVYFPAKDVGNIALHQALGLGWEKAGPVLRGETNKYSDGPLVILDNVPIR